jgi:hypothetical protein
VLIREEELEAWIEQYHRGPVVLEKRDVPPIE